MMIVIGADPQEKPRARGHRRRHRGDRYPSFPPVLCILDGANREALTRRRTAILALLRSSRALNTAEEIRISLALAEDLRTAGPFAPIFRELREPGAEVDWLGRVE